MRYGEKLDKTNKRTILSLSWRDIKSPTAGGAEVQTHQMLSKVDMSKYRVVHIAAQYEGLPEDEVIDEVQYIRKGSIYSVIWYAFLYYKKNRKCIDYVLDQCNTHRFFTPFWVKRKKRIFYIHQLTREIWDINLKAPLNVIGKAMENPCLWIYRKDYTIALSNSTRKDLLNIGFDANKVMIFPVAMQIEPWEISEFLPKENNPTFTYVGRYVEYKGIDAAVEAVGLLRKKYPNSKLWILGKKNEDYVEQKIAPLCMTYGMSLGEKKDNADVVCWGFVSEEKKLELLSRTTALVFPSNREGWGIPISEAAYVGTPSIVYDSEGLRDAVDEGKAGYLCKEKSAKGLLAEMNDVIENKERYEKMREAAYQFSKEYLDLDISRLLEKLLERMERETTEI